MMEFRVEHLSYVYKIKYLLLMNKEPTNPIAFTKKVKYTTRTETNIPNSRNTKIKPHSNRKHNFKQSSSTSKSKHKPTSPNPKLMKNARQQNSHRNNDSSKKQILKAKSDSKQSNPLWSIQTSIQAKHLFVTPQPMQTKGLRIQKSQRLQKQDKKQRKWSENIQSGYQALREEHQHQRQTMQKLLSQHEIHRLNKIYAIEQKQYMIKVVCEKKQ